jgi:hypothetical protein
MTTTPARWDRAGVVAAFAAGGRWFADIVGRVGHGQWSGPGLGVWTVRELVGHGARAFTTTEEYLVDDAAAAGMPADRPASEGGGDAVAGAAAYFLQVRDNPALHQDVAERGRQAGAALGAAPGDTPAAEIGALVERVSTLVGGAPATAVFRSRFGVLPFGTYLATRVVEIVVHTVDLERACGFEVDVPPGPGSLAVAVVGELAVQRGSAGDVLDALGGRRPLPAGFGVFE